MGRSDADKYGWTVADFNVMMCLATNLASNCVLTIIEDVSGDAQDGVPMLLSLLHATGPQPGVMAWGDISFDSQPPMVIIRGTLTTQRCVNDILRTVLLPFLLQYLDRIFQKTRPDHMRHVLL
ncbi:hypothetical protein TNCV_2290041 [Trichonephila clavipes]|uniref:Uncharacterized protein n=1 Tax=Trichonephila clavipes TaxID=2585209 RepID=A0A8X6RNZ9_TRICX|nr:hypothetical protein TNCV_2290041 [Trichonephila clavipes]